ncbi:MAG: AsmA-like C-terminal region-containing protein, partial [Hyphomicrobium sp.]
AKGTLDGGAPFAAVLEQSTGIRRMLVESTDAGQVMKLMDFYPNLQNGRLQLEVNLDGKGPAEKTGVLWVERFRVLGDPIVSEVVGSADDGRPAIGGKGKVTREVFEFDRMRAPFSVGYGQFVLEESYLKGPLVGANLRGKVDFKTRRINIGGTYIPLQGLNGALGGIPLLGQLISGAHGEGIFGITFAVQGPMSEPQVLVNPLSLVAPGIFREMFQMTGQNPSVQVREDRVPAKPVQERVRASSTPAGASAGAPKRIAKPSVSPNAVVDGWSSTTSGGAAKKTN